MNRRGGGGMVRALRGPMRKTHSIHFHCKTHCGLSYDREPKPDLCKAGKFPTCKRCKAGVLEFLCVMLQMLAETLEAQAQAKADELAAAPR